MKNRARFITFSIFLISIGILFTAPVYSAAKMVTLTGVIEPQEEDEEGNVTSISLSVNVTGPEDEEETLEYYLVKLDANGKKLMANVNSKANVTGSVSTDKSGNKTITVNKYEILKKIETIEENEEDFE